MLRAVLFDLDDTLFDHRHSSREAISVLQREYYTDIGHVDIDELEIANLDILNSVHVEVLAGTITPDEARMKRFGMLFRKYGLTYSPERLREVAELYRLHYQSSRRATPGAKSLLRAIRDRGIKTAIISNNLVDEQMDKLEHCELLDLLDSITISEEAGFAKPDPRIFQIALDRLQCEPDEAIIIGDSWENDIIGAQAVGIKGLWYNCYLKEQPDTSVPEIRSLEDSEEVLRLLFSLYPRCHRNESRSKPNRIQPDIQTADSRINSVSNPALQKPSSKLPKDSPSSSALPISTHRSIRILTTSFISSLSPT
jgi:putative hydrolase of the HAD superfamily